MIVIAAALLGAVIGGMTAKRRKGSTADIAQYATGYGIAFALLGLIVTIVIDKAVL
ncbi:apolipoprotein acyltransferase [Aestuariicoccus sp. MJ-SS9]|uniref:apolipoprotein acyltransferase n=1 Tax=Aestuariicoccus sp. MJ-SS9 TaxID=3079855 RepID=UPI00290C9A50|nr:apolipoprotein acyltransferase [Aestuariicoccus sp. MJ-SS9]MDU8910583.1 apolipoprotein acyltransferase [Aestuariicoccus sp. MJ-SS9]